MREAGEGEANTGGQTEKLGNGVCFVFDLLSGGIFFPCNDPNQ